jgi:hypothetical protein
MSENDAAADPLPYTVDEAAERPGPEYLQRMRQHGPNQPAGS